VFFLFFFSFLSFFLFFCVFKKTHGEGEKEEHTWVGLSPSWTISEVFPPKQGFVLPQF